MQTKFFINWLKLACIITGLTGMIAAAASTVSGSGIWLFLFDLLKWPLNNDPSGFQDETLAVNAVLGGVMLGWATLMFFLVNGPISKGNTELIKYILIALIVWFLVDSTGSVLAGLSANVVLNVLFLALFIPPLMALRRNAGINKSILAREDN